MLALVLIHATCGAYKPTAATLETLSLFFGPFSKSCATTSKGGMHLV